MANTGFFSAPKIRLTRTVAALVTAIALVFGAASFAAPASAATAPSGNSLRDWAYKMLAQMNGERLRNHVHSLTMNYTLRKAATAHDYQMQKYNTMSHRLPGEADLAPRIVAAGYTPWCYVAENVAWTTDISWGGSLGVSYLQNLMYTEKPPNDGHRLNILNPRLKEVGITIIYDATHKKLWITQDFATHYC